MESTRNARGNSKEKEAPQKKGQSAITNFFKTPATGKDQPMTRQAAAHA